MCCNVEYANFIQGCTVQYVSKVSTISKFTPASSSYFFSPAVSRIVAATYLEDVCRTLQLDANKQNETSVEMFFVFFLLPRDLMSWPLPPRGRVAAPHAAGGASHFTSGDSRYCASGSSGRVSALSLFPFPPPRSLTPPLFILFLASFVFGFVCLFCFVFCLRSLSLREASELSESFFFFFSKSSYLFLYSSTMGDIEAPDSDRPRQTVLLSVLPSKEFASSRKGMLLIAEVVRKHRRILP